MKSVIVYDSNFGNTKVLAEIIALELQGTVHSVNDIKLISLTDVDLLIVGSPINAWRPTSNIRSFLKSLPADSLSGMNAAAFDTRINMWISGNAARIISKTLAEKGAEIIIPPQAFYVKDKEGPLVSGEVERAKQWAKQIAQKIKND